MALKSAPELAPPDQAWSAPALGTEALDIAVVARAPTEIHHQTRDARDVERTPDTTEAESAARPPSTDERGSLHNDDLAEHSSFVVAKAKPTTESGPVPGAVVALPLASSRARRFAIGSADVIRADEIAGWVWDPATPEESIDVEILDGDTVVLKARADQFRSDLLQAGFGNGHHGFVLRGLRALFPLARHRVHVRRARDGLDLPGSPAVITRSGFDESVIDVMDQAVGSALAVATGPDDLAQPLSHFLRLLNDLVNGHDALAHAQGEIRYPPAAELADGVGLTGRMREMIDRLRLTYQPLYFKPSEAPDVSVIIPVFNKFSYTYECLKSMQQALPERPFEIIIVDDCSDDETLLAPLALSGAVRVVRNPSNLGFVRTCNAGAAVAKGRYLFFLNNDTLVKEGWLDALVETFEKVPNVGIAGSKLLFNDGTLQEVGGIVWRMGNAWNWGRNRDPNEPGFCFLRDSDYVSGAALMIERALFNELDGFDEYFAPAYYEDTDLAFRVRGRGKRVVVQPASEIVHLEGVSAGTDTAGSGMKRYQVINHRKFYQRWKDTLITHRFDGEYPELEAERTVTKRAYFIDDTVPTPDQDAGSNAAVEHMRLLMELGYKVTFLPADNMAKIDPYTRQLQKLGVECQYYPFRWSVEEEFRKAQHKPDLVYLHRHSNASKYAAMVRRYFPKTRIVYSVADLHFLRMERRAKVEGNVELAAEAGSQRRAEMAVMANVDCVIVHSPVEAELLRGANPVLNVEIVPWTVQPRPTERAFADRAGIAFVGGFGHPPNVDAAQHLARDIVPALRRRLVDCTTYLVGSKMTDEMRRLQMPGLVPIGFVPVLADILHTMRCTVVPLRYGAGIKGKVLDSLAHGLPCVLSEIAAEGLELPEDLAWLVARTPAECVEKLVRVHEDEAFNRKLAEAGLRYIALRYSAAAIKVRLARAVAEKAVASALA